MTRLALLRHGHTDWNRAGRIQGRSDIPLDEEACETLGTLRLPAPWDKADLYSSPLSRAVQTARLVAERDPVVTDALTEMHWGDWEGRRGLDLASDAASGYRPVEDWGWDYRPPGGESPAELRARLVPWLATLRRDSIAVTHIGVMRVLLAEAHGWAFHGPAPFRIKRNRLYVIEVGQPLRPACTAPPRLVPWDAK